MGIGLARTLFGPSKTNCSKCHREVDKVENGDWFCDCSGRMWVEY